MLIKWFKIMALNLRGALPLTTFNRQLVLRVFWSAHFFRDHFVIPRSCYRSSINSILIGCLFICKKIKNKKKIVCRSCVVGHVRKGGADCPACATPLSKTKPFSQLRSKSFLSRLAPRVVTSCFDLFFCFFVFAEQEG